MFTAGIDVGMLWTKAAVLQGDTLVGSGVCLTGYDCNESAEKALRLALETLDVVPDGFNRVVATGAGRSEVRFAHDVAAEVVCLTKGVGFLDPTARGVIDLGGESTLAVKLDEQGETMDYAKNDKCAAGTGIFLDAMGKLMGFGLEEMGPLSLQSTSDVDVTSMCVVFAESEVVSLIHRQTSKEDILHGIHKSIAVRIYALANRIGLTGNGGKNVVVGGLAKNIGILSCLENLMEEKLIVPEDPQIVSALGAAVIAATQGGEQ